MHPRSRVRTRPKRSDFSGENIHNMPSFGGELKPSAHVADLRHVKEPCDLRGIGIAGQIDRRFLAQFRHSLTEVSHVA
jgi:hypothetical protein